MSRYKAGKKTEIHVLYALVDRTGNYSKLAGASICSLFENTKEKVTIHLFHDGSIKDKNEERFLELAATYKQKLILYNVHELLPEVWREAKEIFADALRSAQYTEATMYRLVAPQVLPNSVKRLIYIDADTIVHIDIKRLWDTPLGKNGMGAVRESTLLLHYGMKPVGGSAEKMYEHMGDQGVTLETCFNAGILLIDMEKMRSMGNILLSGLRVLAEYPEENRFYDQNILNYYFAKDLTPLPWYYNILQHWDRKHAEAAEVEGIYHYMGKSLGMNGNDVRDTLFYDYFIKTPWCDGEFLCRIHGVMNQVYMKSMGPRLRDMRRLMSILAVKCPVILATEECEQQAKKLFAAPDDFDIEEPKKEDNEIEAGSVEEIKKIEAERKRKAEEAEKNKKKYELPKGICYCSLGKEESMKLNLPYDIDTHFYIFFVIDYKRVKKLFHQIGLKEREHFMNGAFLLVGKPWLDNLIITNKFFEML